MYVLDYSRTAVTSGKGHEANASSVPSDRAGSSILRVTSSMHMSTDYAIKPVQMEIEIRDEQLHHYKSDFLPFRTWCCIISYFVVSPPTI